MAEQSHLQFEANVDPKNHNDFRVRNKDAMFVRFIVKQRSETKFEIETFEKPKPGCAFVGLLVLAVSGFAFFKLLQPFFTDQPHDEWMSKLLVGLVAGAFGFLGLQMGFAGLRSITRMLIDSEKREVALAWGSGRRTRTLRFNDLEHVRLHIDHAGATAATLVLNDGESITLPWIGFASNDGGWYPIRLAMVLAARTVRPMRIELSPGFAATLAVRPTRILQTLGELNPELKAMIVEQHDAMKQALQDEGFDELDDEARAELEAFNHPFADDNQDNRDRALRNENNKSNNESDHIDSDVDTDEAQPTPDPLAANPTLQREFGDPREDPELLPDVAAAIAQHLGEDEVQPLALMPLRSPWYHHGWLLLCLGFFLGIGFGCLLYIEITGIKPVPHLQAISMGFIGIVIAFALPRPRRWQLLGLFETQLVRISKRGDVEAMPLVAIELVHRNEAIVRNGIGALTQTGVETDIVRLVGPQSWRLLISRAGAAKLGRLLKQRCDNAIFIADDGKVLMPKRPDDWRETDWQVLMRRWLRRSFGAEINGSILMGTFFVIAGVASFLWLLIGAMDGSVDPDGRNTGRGAMLGILLAVLGCFGWFNAGVQFVRYRRLLAMLNAPRPDEQYIKSTETDHLQYTLDRPRSTIVTAGDSALTLASLPLLVIPFLGMGIAIAAFIRTRGKKGPWNTLCWISLIGSIAWTGTVAIGLLIEALE